MHAYIVLEFACARAQTTEALDYIYIWSGLRAHTRTLASHTRRTGDEVAERVGARGRLHQRLADLRTIRQLQHMIIKIYGDRFQETAHADASIDQRIADLRITYGNT